MTRVVRKNDGRAGGGVASFRDQSPIVSRPGLRPDPVAMTVTFASSPSCLVDDGAEDDLGVLVRGLHDERGGLVDFGSVMVGPPVMLMMMPVAPSTEIFSRSGLEIALSPLPPRGARLRRARAHEREALVGHDRLHVGEVGIDETGVVNRDQRCPALRSGELHRPS